MEKTRRKGRRTNEQIDRDMMSAIGRIISKKGFGNISLSKFVNEARIDPNVFYRRYATIDDVYRALAKSNDYFVDSNFNVSDLQKLGDKEFLRNDLKKLHETLRKNPLKQKFLIWELADMNEITKHSAQLRDTMNSNFILYYQGLFNEAKLDVTPIIALLLAGVNYLTLQRGIATFCLIDFNSEEGINKMYAAIDYIVELLFFKIEQQKKQENLAKEMSKDKIPHLNICKYLDITEQELSALLK